MQVLLWYRATLDLTDSSAQQAKTTQKNEPVQSCPVPVERPVERDCAVSERNSWGELLSSDSIKHICLPFDCTVEACRLRFPLAVLLKRESWNALVPVKHDTIGKFYPLLSLVMVWQKAGQNCFVLAAFERVHPSYEGGLSPEEGAYG